MPQKKTAFPPNCVLDPDQGGTGISLTGIGANYVLVSDGADNWVLTTLANLAAALGTVTAAAAVTLTNKRITARISSTATGGATPAVNTDNYDELHLTAQDAAITSMTTGLTGAPVSGDVLIVEITDNGAPQAIAWGAKFESSTIPLPVTTVASALLTVTLKWNAATTKWRCVGVA